MDYKQALEQAVIYIENHLHEDIKVEEVSRFAGYSYYHLNRQFIAVLGESVGSYIKKRRLANAAQKLLYTNDSIISIALENSFESPEAFSRAFKSRYKISPLQYRRQQIQTFVSSKKRLDEENWEHLLHHVTVHPRIVELSEIKIAGIRQEVQPHHQDLKKLWEFFFPLLESLPNKKLTGRKFGIYESFEANLHFKINEDMLLNEYFGIEVTSFNDLPEHYVTKVIPSGRYVVFTHHGSLETLSQTIDYIWGTWMLSTKEELDNRDPFELYGEKFLGYEHPDSEIEIYIAIR